MQLKVSDWAKFGWLGRIWYRYLLSCGLKGKKIIRMTNINNITMIWLVTWSRHSLKHVSTQCWSLLAHLLSIDQNCQSSTSTSRNMRQRGVLGWRTLPRQRHLSHLTPSGPTIKSSINASQDSQKPQIKSFDSIASLIYILNLLKSSYGVRCLGFRVWGLVFIV